MGVDIKSGLIAKDFSSFAQAKLSSMFSGKDVKLSGIETSGFKNLAIRDFSIARKPDSTPILSVDKIIIDYSILNLALRRFENLGKIYLVSPTLYVNPKQEAGFNLPAGASSYLLNTSAYAGKLLKFQILNGNIAVLGEPPVLKNLEGQVALYDTNLRLNKVKGVFLDIPVLVSGTVNNILERPVIKLKVTAEDKYYSINCAFRNTDKKGEGRIWGSVRLFDRFQARFKGLVNFAGGQAIQIEKLILVNPADSASRFSVSGDINLSNRSSKLVIVPKAGLPAGDSDPIQSRYIKIIAAVTDSKALSVYAKISHLDFLGHDLISEININTGLYKTDGSREVLKGSLRTQTLILDYKPFKDIALKWILKNKELFITDFELGDAYRLFGKIKLNKPYRADLNLSINNAELTDWFIFSNPSYAASVSGLVNGKVKMEGPIGALVTDGRLNIKEGNISDIKFNAINFNLKGKGPILVISDSRIFKDGGFLSMDGEVDLRKFGKRNLLENLKIATDQKVIVWEGWDITKSPSEIMAKKGISEDVAVNFKTYVTAGNKNGLDDEDKKSEVGLDYKIKKDDSINLRMKDDSTFVGVEHKMKF